MLLLTLFLIGFLVNISELYGTGGVHYKGTNVNNTLNGGTLSYEFDNDLYNQPGVAFSIVDGREQRTPVSR